MTLQELKIAIYADATAATKVLNGIVKTTTSTVSKIKNSFKNGLDFVKNHWMNVSMAIRDVMGIVKKGFDMAQEFAMYKQGLDRLNKDTGGAANSILAHLNKISKGTISNAKLVETANRAMALGVADSAEEMGDLLEIARLKAQKI